MTVAATAAKAVRPKAERPKAGLKKVAKAPLKKVPKAAAAAWAPTKAASAHDDTAAVIELWGKLIVSILADEISEERDIGDLGDVLWSLSAFRYYVQVFRGMQAMAPVSADGMVNLQMSATALRKYAIAMAKGRVPPKPGGGRASPSECMVAAACGGTCTLTTPFMSLVHTEDYHTVVVWERAPISPEDTALMRVYLEMALDLSRPLCIMGNVCGIRELPPVPVRSGAGDEPEDITAMFSEDSPRAPSDPAITTDLFLLVHTADVARFMTPRATGMGMRFYEELLAEGKRFSVMPNRSFSKTPWGCSDEFPKIDGLV